MHERPAAAGLVALEEREVDDPVEHLGLRVGEGELAAEVRAQAAEHARVVSSSAAAKSTVVPGSGPSSASSRSERNFAIGDRTSPDSSPTR